MLQTPADNGVRLLRVETTMDKSCQEVGGWQTDPGQFRKLQQIEGSNPADPSTVDHPKRRGAYKVTPMQQSGHAYTRS